jgi:hypothetical protein
MIHAWRGTHILYSPIDAGLLFDPPERRLNEAVLFLHFELVDEYSEMPGHGSRKGVVLVLKAFPNR